MGLDLDDELIGVSHTSGEDEIVLGMRNGLAIRFDEGNVRAMGRTARGVKGVDLRGDDRVVDLVVTNESASLLTVCDLGYGKRTQVGEYRKTRRGGKGVINIKTTARNGKVVALKSVVDTDELMFISAKGIVLRTDLRAVREIGRATQGIRLIRVDEGDSVVAVAKIIPEDENGNGKAGANGDGTDDAESASTPDPAAADEQATDPVDAAPDDAGSDEPATGDETPEA
jgi:DNA gyrase subunit A